MTRAISLFLAVWPAIGFSPAWASTPQVVFGIGTVAGSSNIGDGGRATSAQMGNIQGIAADRLGNLYLSDPDRALIRKINAGGVINTVAGTGAAGFSGDGGLAASAAINLPYGLAADTAGNVYFADLGNNRVRRIGVDGSIKTVAGTGAKGSLGDGGLAINAELNTPRNVALDAAGNLYIAEFEGHRIREVTADGKIATIAGTGIAGFRGDGGLAITAQLAYPAGIAFDHTGNLYVADSQNNRVRKIVPGGNITTVLGGSAAIALDTPVGVAVDAAGDLFAVDNTTIVRVYTAAGAWNIEAGTGVAGFAGDGGPATKALVSSPRDLALDPAGDVYIADGVRIREVNLLGVIQTVAGDAYLHAVGDGGPATSAILNQPLGVALDRLGNLYIADSLTQRVRVVASTGNISTFAGTGMAGFVADNVPATAAPLNNPMGVMADPYGEVYIADTSDERIREVVSNGYIATFAGTGVGGDGPEGALPAQTALLAPRNLCIGLTGAIYISDTSNSRIVRVVPGGLLAIAAGNGTQGWAGDGGPARGAEINQPTGCAVDANGNLFFADTGNHRIAEVTATGVISTVAGTGQAALGADGGAAALTALNAPRGVAVDGNGNLFIADTGNNLIREVTPDGIIHNVAGQPAGGFGGDGGPALSALLNGPAGLVEDGAGNLYVADAYNNRVRKLTPQAAVTVVNPQLPIPTVTAVSAASLASGAIAPGEILTIYGSGIGPQAGVSGVLDSTGTLPASLSGAQVLFDGVAAPLFYAQAGQVNVQAPYTIAPQQSTFVQVEYQGAVVAASSLPVAVAAPAIFPAILNPDGTLNSASNPAAHNGVLTFFATGEGLTNGPNAAGVPAAYPYPVPQLVVGLTINGAAVSLLYAGEAPGLLGMLQMDAQVPTGLPSGTVTVQLTVGPTAAPPISVWMQ